MNTRHKIYQVPLKVDDKPVGTVIVSTEPTIKSYPEDQDFKEFVAHTPLVFVFRDKIKRYRVLDLTMFDDIGDMPFNIEYFYNFPKKDKGLMGMKPLKLLEIGLSKQNFGIVQELCRR